MKVTGTLLNPKDPAERVGISGCLAFDGEDKTYEDRKKKQQAQQKDWIEQQHKEKMDRKKLAKEEEKFLFCVLIIT